MIAKQTAMERTLTALSQREPDRVPVFLATALLGAREIGLPLRNYFAKASNVAEGQLRLSAKFDSDGLFSCPFAAIEAEAWGGEVIYRDDGPPNAGAPPIDKPEKILHMVPPEIESCPGLVRALETTEILKERTKGTIPIVGVVVSPFSLPVMQLGFDRYFELVYERPDLFERLMALNCQFSTNWANALLAAGATAISYADPLSSPMIFPKELYARTGREIAARMLAAIKGPTVIHLASAPCLPILEDIIACGAVATAAGVSEDQRTVKQAAAGRITVLGNLNGVEMRRWTEEQAGIEVKKAIAAAASGGGYILCDAHGEIPLQVTDDILFALMAAARQWGQYPLSWTDHDGGN